MAEFFNPTATSTMVYSSEGKIHRHHTSRQFDQELLSIRDHVLALGGLADEQIELAMKALVENDFDLAQEVIRDDEKINEMELTVNDECTQVLARRQPAAGDLRLVVAGIKTIADLARIGDDAKRIARVALAMSSHYPRKNQLRYLHEFSLRVRVLLKDTLDAFARLDVEAAMSVKQRDRSIDGEYETIMRRQIANMTEDARSIPVALNMIWVAKALERIGDRTCNICEYVVYYALGKDIRHMTLEQATQDLLEHRH